MLCLIVAPIALVVRYTTDMAVFTAFLLALIANLFYGFTQRRSGKAMLMIFFGWVSVYLGTMYLLISNHAVRTALHDNPILLGGIIALAFLVASFPLLDIYEFSLRR